MRAETQTCLKALPNAAEIMKMTANVAFGKGWRDPCIFDRKCMQMTANVAFGNGWRAPWYFDRK